jgi:hypothetical protein
MVSEERFAIEFPAKSKAILAAVASLESGNPEREQRAPALPYFSFFIFHFSFCILPIAFSNLQPPLDHPPRRAQDYHVSFRPLLAIAHIPRS